MSTLEERLEAGFADAWNPIQNKDEKRVLIGKVVEISQRENEYGFYPIITVLQDDGTEKAVHGFHTVLKNELIRQKPQPGERIGFRYDGFIETPEGKFKGYEKFTVKIEREQGAFDWSKLGVPEEDPTPPAPEPDPVVVPSGTNVEDDEIPF